MVFLQPEQCQIPTDWRRTVLRPQNVLILELASSHCFYSFYLPNVPGVAGVLRNFHTLDLLTEGSTVSEFVVNIHLQVYQFQRQNLT